MWKYALREFKIWCIENLSFIINCWNCIIFRKHKKSLWKIFDNKFFEECLIMSSFDILICRFFRIWVSILLWIVKFIWMFHQRYSTHMSLNLMWIILVEITPNAWFNFFVLGPMISFSFIYSFIRSFVSRKVFNLLKKCLFFCYSSKQASIFKMNTKLHYTYTFLKHFKWYTPKWQIKKLNWTEMKT